jgi:hypothetical protein
MKRFAKMPHELVDGWPSSIQRHDGGEQFALHYHDVEEWLEVLEREICFVSAGGHEYPLVKGEALRIPQGEAHRVQVGSGGVEYRMWLSVEVRGQPFMRPLDTEDILGLIRDNLAVPGNENLLLARENPNDPEVENRWQQAEAFFRGLLSEQLLFRTARGALLNKDAFLARPRPDTEVERSSSGSVRILHKSDESVILSTVVYTRPGTAGPQDAYSNTRLFVKEGESWKCRVWLNYPKPGAS